MVKFTFILLFFTTLLLLVTSQSINFKCESVFGRTANGDGTNTYSFICTCDAEINGTTIQGFCRSEGADTQNNCRTFAPFISSDRELTLTIPECTLGSAQPQLFIRQGGRTYEPNFPLNCQGEGIAGVRCSGRTTI